MHVQVSTRAEEQAVIVQVAGDVDAFTAPRLREGLLAAYAGEPRAVVLDLTETDFLDSSALGTLVGVQKEQAAGSSVLRVACPRPHLRKLFAISRLDEVMPVYDTLEAALAG